MPATKLPRRTLAERRAPILDAVRNAIANVGPMSHGTPSNRIGRAALSNGWTVAAYWMFHRGNPGAWRMWLEVRDHTGAVVVQRTGMHTLARVFVDYVDRMHGLALAEDAERATATAERAQ
jgi:hypothetical protein